MKKFASLLALFCLVISVQHVSAQCNAVFFVPASSCTNVPLTFTNNSNPGGSRDSSYWSWSGANTGTQTDSGRHNLSVTFATAGVTNVCLIYVSDTCRSNQICHNDTVYSPPVAPIFTYTPTGSNCAGRNLLFTITNYSAANSYTWTFGDGGTGSGNNVSHAYTSVGNGTMTYTVTLTVRLHNCTNTSTQTISVLQSPSAAITAGGGVFQTVFNGSLTFYKCANTGQNFSNFTFLNGASPATGLTSTIIWGDTTANYTNAGNWTTVSHVYLRGLYTMKYIVQNSNGCADTAVYKVFFGSNPAGGIASLGSTDICGPAPLTFGLSNYQTNAPGTLYTVQFNDGSAPIIFNHPPPDTFSHLFVISSCGFTSSNGVTTFNNSYSASLTVSNPCGVTAGAVVPIYVSVPPIAAFSVSPDTNDCVNSVVTFTNRTIGGKSASNNTCDSTSNFLWNITPATGWTTSGSFGSDNGFIGNNFDPSSWTPGSGSLPVTFTIPGTYRIRLVSANGCGADTVYRNVCIVAAPTLAFTINPSIGCGPVTVTTNNTSNIPISCVPMVPSWSVAQSSTCTPDSASAYVYVTGNASSTNPVIRFNNQGSYTLRLNLSNNICNITLPTQTVTVKSKPNPAVNGIYSVCQNSNITLSAGGFSCGGTVTGYSWSIPNAVPSSGTGSSITTHFIASGSQQVTLSDTNECGHATTTAFVNVVAAPVANAGPDISFCSGGTSSIGSSYVSGNYYSWSPSSGLYYSNSANPTIQLYSSGTTIYTLTVTNSIGCSATDAVNVTVNPNPGVFVTPSNSSICFGGNVKLTASGANTYTWSPTGSLTFFGSSDSVFAHPTSTTTYTVTGTITATGCNSTATSTVNVNPLPIVTTPASVSLCNQPIPTQITGANPPGGTWSGPNITSSGVFTPTGTGSFVVTYSYTTIYGCTSTSSTTVNVVTAVTPSAGPDDTACQNAAPIIVTGTPSGGTWSGTYVTPSGSFASPTVGTYPLVYTYGSGSCAKTDTMIMTVNTGPSVMLAPSSATICLRDSVKLIASGADTYTWSPSGSLTMFAASDSVWAKPITTTTYTVTGTLSSNGCFNTATSTITVKPLPVVTNSPLSQTLCSDLNTTAVNLTANLAGTTFTWNAVASGVTGFTPSGTNTIPSQFLINMDTAVHTVKYYIVPMLNGCYGDTVVYTIFVKPIPRTMLPAYQTVCTGTFTSVVYFNTLLSSTSYTWTASAPAGVTGFNINGNSDSLHTLYLTNTNPTIQEVTFLIYPYSSRSGCAGPTVVYIDTVIPKPNISLTPDVQTVCNDSTSRLVMLTSNSPDVHFVWNTTQPAGITGVLTTGAGDSIPPMVLSNATLQSTSIVYYAHAITNNHGCLGDTGTCTIAVQPKPIAFVTVASDTVCSGVQMNIMLSSNLASTQFTWTVVAPPIVSGASAGNGTVINQIITNTTPNPVAVTYIITPHTNGCPGDTVSQTMIVNPSASVNLSLPKDTICSGGTSVPVYVSSATTPVSFSWSSVPQPGVAGILSGAANDTIPAQTITNNNHSPVNILYLAHAIYDGCPGPDSIYTVTINPTPHITTPPNTQIVCSNDTSSPIVLSSDVVGATFTWQVISSINLSGFTASGSGNTIPTQTIFNSSNHADTLIYQATPSFRGCPGPPMNFYIIVRPEPFVTATPDTQFICTKTTSQTIHLTSTIAGTSFSWSGISSNLTSSTLTGNTDSIVAHYFENISPRGDTGIIHYTITSIAAGCAGNPITAVLMVQPIPIPNFGMAPNTGCSPLLVQFAANAVVFGDPDSITYHWGDSTANTTLQPSPVAPRWPTIGHSFVNHSSISSATYTITLVVHGHCGDSAVSQQITVLPNTVNAFFTTDSISGCSPLTVHFRDFSTGSTYSNWCMNFDAVHDSCVGTSLILPSGSTTQQTYQAGTYTVALYITDGCSRDTAFQTITVYQSPIANFTDSSIICQGHAINFYDQSQGISLFTGSTWSFGDGATDVNTNTTHGYAASGVYQVCHSITTVDGCRDSICRNITVSPSPVVTINGLYDTICSGAQTNITFSSNIVGTTYSWTSSAPAGVTGAQNGIGYNIHQTLINSATYPQTVSYIITPLAAGCYGAPDTVNVLVNPSPVVVFSTDTQSICSGTQALSVQLGSTSSNVTLTWTAVQPAGVTGVITSGTDSIPVQTLVNHTTGIVSINYTGIATTIAGQCAGSPATASIRVYPQDTMQSSIVKQTICANTSSQPIVFNSPVAGTTYNWSTVATANINGNTPSTGTGNVPAFALTNSTTVQGSVIITVTPTANGCAGSPMYDTILVNPVPVASIAQSPQIICSGSSTAAVNVTSNVTGTTYAWTGSAPAGVTGYTANGIIGTIPAQTISNSNATSQVVTFTITPTAGGCAGLPITYTDTVNPSPITQFSVPAQTICSGSATANVALFTATPLVTFSWTAAQPAGITGVTTSGTSTIPVQTLVNSTFSPITVTYTANAYTVGLVCQGPAATYNIIVNPTPDAIANHSSDTICSNTATNISFTSSTIGTTYAWTVSAPGSVSGAAAGSGALISQVLQNSSTQPQTVTYTITPTANNCPGTPIQVTVVVKPVPIVVSNPTSQSICSGTNTQAILFSSATPNTTYSWTCNANGAGGTLPTGNDSIGIETLTNTLTAPVSAIYTVIGTYNGCQGLPYYDTITVKPLPTINIGASQSVCEGTATSAVALTSTPTGSVVTYTWVVTSSSGVTGFPASGSASTIPSFTPSNPNDTVTPVVYTITPTSAGCQGSTFNYTVLVKPVPVVSVAITSDTICSGGNLLVGITADVVGTTFTWTVNAPPSISGASNGGGSSINQTLINSLLQLQSLTYTVTPSYLACAGTPLTFTAYVQPAPDVNLPGIQTICSRQSIAPVILSSSAAGVSFTWTTTSSPNMTGYTISGGGNIPAQRLTDTSHTADGTVDYQITPHIGGCDGAVVDYVVNVNHDPLSLFSFTNSCVNSQPAPLVDLSVGGNFYNWDFGDGNTSASQTTSHSYATDGSYTITLIVRSTAGCYDTSSQVVTIFPMPHAIFTLPVYDYCNAPQSITMLDSSTGAQGYAWNLGNGSTSTLVSPTGVYTDTGGYTIQLIVSNTFGCYDTLSRSIYIHKQPHIISVDITPQKGCQQLDVSLAAVATNANYYRWNFGDGTVIDSTVANMYHSYPDTGTYSVSVTAYAFNNCWEQMYLHDTITVYLRSTSIFSYTTPDTIIGAGAPVTFLNQSLNAVDYLWQFGNGQTSGDSAPVYRYPDFGVYTIALITTSKDGCKDTAYSTIFIKGGKLFVPNAFAPEFNGGTELARVWKPSGFGLSTYHAQIFNTYGELLWESDKLVDTEPSESWDGTYKGTLVQQDVYVWKIDAVFLNGSVWTGMSYQGKAPKVIGDVTVVR